MARRRPGAVRAAQQRARHRAVVPGLSPSTCRSLNRLDRPELRPDVVGAALRRWEAAAQDPGSRRRSGHSATGPLFSDQRRHEDDQFYCPACAAGDGGQLEPTDRDILRRAAYALPRGQSRQLRRLVHQADRRVLRATLPDPARDADEPWWYRRIPTR